MYSKLYCLVTATKYAFFVNLTAAELYTVCMLLQENSFCIQYHSSIRVCQLCKFYILQILLLQQSFICHSRKRLQKLRTLLSSKLFLGVLSTTCVKDTHSILTSVFHVELCQILVCKKM